MKNLVLLSFLICSVSYSQTSNPDKECLLFSKDLLNYSNKNQKENFNAYVKDNNICMDIQYRMNYLNSDIPDLKIQMLPAQAKEPIYDLTKQVCTIFEKNIKNPNVDPLCNPENYEFNVIYTTLDLKKYIYTYWIQFKDLALIVDNFNTHDVDDILIYKYRKN